MVAIIPWASFCQHQAQLRHVSEDGGGDGGGGDGGDDGDDEHHHGSGWGMAISWSLNTTFPESE